MRTNIETRIKKIENELEKIKNDLKPETTWTKNGDLEWSENLGEMDWYDAVKVCEELGGRLPERWEIIKVIDEGHNFDVSSGYFWSATEYSSTAAWYVYLSFGFTSYYTKTNTYQVRCVR